MTRVSGWCTVCKRTGSCEHLQVPHDQAVAFLTRKLPTPEIPTQGAEPYRTIAEWVSARRDRSADRLEVTRRTRATLERLEVLDRKCAELEQSCKAARARIEQLEEGCHVAVWGERSR